MATMARIQNGVVAEVLTADPFPTFHPSLVWVPCDSTVQQGYLYDGVNFTAPVVPGLTADAARAQRDALVNATDWLVQRHRDQTEAGSATTLTAEQYVAVQTYRTALRNVPEQSGFPSSVTWPTYPI